MLCECGVGRPLSSMCDSTHCNPIPRWGHPTGSLHPFKALWLSLVCPGQHSVQGRFSPVLRWSVSSEASPGAWLSQPLRSVRGLTIIHPVFSGHSFTRVQISRAGELLPPSLFPCPSLSCSLSSPFWYSAWQAPPSSRDLPGLRRSNQEASVSCASTTSLTAPA